MPRIELLLIAAAFLLGAGITGLMKVYAQRVNLVDLPNQRSSHAAATPRGGGISIVLVFLGTVLALWAYGELAAEAAIAILAGGGLVAGIGFADDHSHVASRWRFLVQVIAATVAVTMLGGLPEIQFGQTVTDLGIVGDIVAVVFVVWFTNAFNFMDGIDGIAAGEAVFIAGAALLLSAPGDSGAMSLLLGVLSGTSLGFLAWNWPPAKIFMGDVGSGFIGFVLAVLAIICSSLGMLSVWCWLILAAVFVVDATITLISRMVNGEEWYSAHKNHAYQKAARRFNGHRPVTLAALGINLLWLLPLAWFASLQPAFGWWLTVVAWMPLILLCIILKAGRPEAHG